MVTPLLASLRTDGGTLYTFSSASKDLTKIFTDDRYSFTFSHFACLNLPNIKNGNVTDKIKNGESFTRGMYLENLLSNTIFQKDHSQLNMYEDSTSINMALAEHLQNYVMNFETAICEGMGDNDDYDDSQLRTVSERVFFNWLVNIGAVDFIPENTTYTVYEANSFVEGNADGTKTDFKDRLVKYIGKIDIINSVDVAGDAYDEVYIHIPGSVGGSEVKFFSVYDKNYDITKKSYKCTGEYIIGRKKLAESDILSPYGLSMRALYDDDVSELYNIKTNSADKGGFCIDFRDDSYDGGIDSMNSMSQDDFEFNCVLLYYTMTDNNTGDAVTNLYGVLFLEEVTVISTENDNSVYVDKGYIQRYPKIVGIKKQNDDGTYSIANGNSYALKIDLKIDTQPDTTMTSKSYEDPNNDYAGALEIYSQSLMQLQELVSKVLNDKKSIQALDERISYLEGNLSLINDIPSMKTDIDNLTDKVNYDDVIYNGENLSELIAYNANQIDSIIQGKTSAKIAVDASAIKAGYGIGITTDSSGNVTINNNLGAYNVSYFYPTYELVEDKKYTSENRLSLFDSKSQDIDVYTDMLEGNNISLLYVKDQLQSDLTIHIYSNDSQYDWKTGQSLRIRIMPATEFNASATKGSDTAVPVIKIICTDSNGDSMYINSEDLQAYKYAGLYEIEIICIDSTASESSNKFIYDMKTR